MTISIKLLDAQRQWIISYMNRYGSNEELEGTLNMLDAIADSLVDNDQVTLIKTE